MVHFLEGVNHLQNGISLPGANIKDIVIGGFRMLTQQVKGRNMGFGQVSHMNKVTYVGTVRGIIIIAEYGQLFA
ncbi:hypothetical protein FQZ97_1111190 [compost metagenome]